MSIEMTLLASAERVSGCSSQLIFPVPVHCKGSVQMMGLVAEHHMLTWLVILVFFGMLWGAATFMMGSGGHH